MSANRFLDLIEAGRVRDAAGLKRAFRGLAKRAHPDAAAASADLASASAEAAHRVFIALRAEYEEALARLAAPGSEGGVAGTAGAGGSATGGNARSGSEPAAKAAARAAGTAAAAAPPPAHPWDRRAFYASFEDLRARGFPRRPPTPGPAAAYARSRAEVLAYLAGRDRLRPAGRLREAFLGLEATWTAQALASSRGRATGLGCLVNGLDNVFYYHRYAFAHMLAIAKSYGADALASLEAEGRADARRFLAFLLEDLDEGPALED